MSHWIDRLVNEVISKKKEPFCITSGATVSGPVHLGTLCECLFPSKIYERLKELGKEVKFYFIMDILDDLDSIPKDMEKYKEELSPYLGVPLCNVPDPIGQYKSFGDRYLSQLVGIMRKFGIEPEILRADEMYKQGLFDDVTKMYLKDKDKVREIIERIAGKKQYFHPLMPICPKCGKISTTRVISDDGENYEFICDKDTKYAKGCGYKGRDNIKNHNYKLIWRLHWPAWQMILGTSIEGAGGDHHAKGGSWDSNLTIFKEFFHKEPPIGFRYGMVLFKGKKYSKSKGIGLGLKELMKLLPPEVITFILVRPDVEENKDIVPTKYSMLRMVEEYEQSKAFYGKPYLSRAEEKRAWAYHFSGKKHWEGHFRDVLLYYSLYRDWNIVAKFLGDSVLYLKPYIEEWVNQDLVPDEYNFTYSPNKAKGLVKEFFESIPNGIDALEIHNFVFEFSKSHNIPAKEMFKMIYKTIINKDRGPRLGRLIHAIGLEKIKKDVL